LVRRKENQRAAAARSVRESPKPWGRAGELGSPSLLGLENTRVLKGKKEDSKKRRGLVHKIEKKVQKNIQKAKSFGTRKHRR